MGWTVLLTHSGTLLPLLCPRQSRLIFHTQNCSCPSAQLHGHRPLSPAAFHLCAKASLIFQAVPHAFPQGLSEHVPRPVAADLSDVTEIYHTPFPALSSQGRQCGTELGLRNHQNYSILFSSQRQQIPQGVLYSWNIPLHPSLAALCSVQYPPSHPQGAAVPSASPSLPSASLTFPLYGRVYFCDESPSWILCFSMAVAIGSQTLQRSEGIQPLWH